MRTDRHTKPPQTLRTDRHTKPQTLRTDRHTKSQRLPTNRHTKPQTLRTPRHTKSQTLPTDRHTKPQTLPTELTSGQAVAAKPWCMIPDAAKSLLGRSALCGLQGQACEPFRFTGPQTLFIFVIQHSYIPMTNLRLVRPQTLLYSTTTVPGYDWPKQGWSGLRHCLLYNTTTVPMADLRLVRPQTLFVIQYGYSSYGWPTAGQASDTICYTVQLQFLWLTYGWSGLRHHLLHGTTTVLSVCMCMCACRCVDVGVVLFWWCGRMYTCNYARWCMSVLFFAYVCMLTAFGTLSLL